MGRAGKKERKKESWQGGREGRILSSFPRDDSKVHTLNEMSETLRVLQNERKNDGTEEEGSHRMCVPLSLQSLSVWWMDGWTG